MTDNKEKIKKQKFEKQLRDEAVSALLATDRGRAYVWWLLEIGKIGIVPFTGNALTGSFMSGELNVGEQIRAHLIEADPDGYITLLKERQNV